MTEHLDDLLLECLEQTPIPLKRLAATLPAALTDDPESTETKIKMVSDALAEKKDFPGLLSWYQELAEVQQGNRVWRKQAHKELKARFADDARLSMFLELCGLASPLNPVRKALRGLKTLSELTPGCFVFEKNRGFGTVQEIDLVQKTVTVDFNGEPGLKMALSFAAEVLSVIDSGHIYARRQLDPEALDALIKEDAAEVIRMTLRSFGPSTAPQMQKLLVPGIMSEAKWKTFWANARKGLKNDPLVVLPAKRTDPLELLERAKSFDAAWFRGLSAQRNMQQILDSLEELIDAGETGAVGDGERPVVRERLCFVVTGAEGKHHDHCVRVWLIARQIGLTPDDVNLGTFLSRAMTEAGLLEVVRALPAKMTKAFFAALAEVDAGRTVDVLLQVLPDLEYSALNEAIHLLFQQGSEARVAEVLRQGWNKWEAEVDVMYWLSMNRDKVAAWNYGTTPDLVARLLKVLNQEYTGSRLRVQNQLREIFRQPTWLKEVLDSMNERQRRAFTHGVKDSSAWQQLDKASVLGQIVKIDRSLQDIVAGRSDDGEGARQYRVTSIRVYKERQAQLDKIINKDIPENSREIGHARSYGDLRENFEYKAAKDTQRLLMQRKAELEAMLREVRPSDLTEFSADAAGIGTTVGLRYPDGREVSYHILGEWDSDSDLGIVSCGSRLAKALIGETTGAVVEVPGEHGVQEAVLVRVEPLPEAIRQWVLGSAQDETN